MSNKITATGAPQTKEAFEAEKASREGVAVPAMTGSGSYTVQGGKTLIESRPQKTHTALTRDVDYKRVQVDGMSIDRELYLRMKAEGSIPATAKVYDPEGERQKLAQGGEGTGPFPQDDAPASKTDDKPVKGDDPVVETIFADGDKAMGEARKSLGEDTVSHLINQAVQTGDVDTIVSAIGEGKVSPSAVTKIVNAYTQSAREIVAGTGVDVDDLAYGLSEPDLRDMRNAVVSGDVHHAQGLARKAADTLASLPATNPAAFREFIGSRFPGLDYEVKNGRAIIHVEGRGDMPFDTLLRMGALRNAKMVSRAEG